jgi:ketosteroid isomerase-like protein
MNAKLSAIPLVISGPIVRHIASDTLTLWMATKESISGDQEASKASINLFDSQQNQIDLEQDALQINEYKVGDNCFISTLIVTQADLFKCQATYKRTAWLLPKSSF